MSLRIRTATENDAELIADQRRSMFLDMGTHSEVVLDTMTLAFIPWVRQKLEIGEYLGWFVVEDDGSVSAGAGLWLMEWLPHMIGSGTTRGNIVNVYTRPDRRRQGLALQLMETILAWCRENGISVVILHASDEGVFLYKKMGFQPTNEMRQVLGG